MPASRSTVRDPVVQPKPPEGTIARASSPQAPGALWSSLALRVEPADSPLEREADSVAAHVVQRKCAECEEEEEDESKRPIHRQHEAGSTDAGGAADAGEAVASVLTSDPGQPLDSSARAYFEPRFSHSFDDVRVHTGAAAAESARSIHARAYTSGSDIVFRDGEFAPDSANGRQLLAHELTHVVQQRSTSDGGTTVARQVAAGVTDEEAAAQSFEPQPQPHPTPSRATDMDETFVPDAGDVARPGVIVFDALPLSNDPTFVEEQLERFITRHRTIEEGVASAKITLERLEARISERRSALSDMSGVTAESEHISSWLERAQPALDVARIALQEMLLEHAAFLKEFQARAEIATASMLDMSLERVTSELRRYGVSVTAHTKTKYQKSADGPMEKTEDTYLTYAMPDSAAGQGLAMAANALAAQLRVIKGLVIQRNDTQGQEAAPMDDPGVYSSTLTILDPERYAALSRQITDARRVYDVLRHEKERDYPILAAYAPIEGFPALGPLTNTIEGLEGIGAGPSSAVAETLSGEITGTLGKIQTTWRNLQTGDLNMWKLPPVIAVTEAAMGIPAGSVKDRLVQEKVDRIHSKELAISIALSVLAVALGILAAIPSGGSSLVAAGTFVAGVGAAGISTYFAVEHLDQYLLESAASGTDFDKARAVSNADPSLFWLAVDIVSAIFDVYAAVKAFGALRKAVQASLAARRAAKNAVELAQAEAKLDEVVKIAEGQPNGEVLGQRVKESILRQPAQSGSDAERAMAHWETSINPESRASLVDNPSLKRAYTEMTEDVRHVLTWCASNCLIPTANKTQVDRVEKLLKKFGKGDTTNLQQYFHMYADDLDTALKNLKDANSWDDVDEIMRMEVFGGTGQTKALSKKEIEAAVDEMFSPRVTGGQRPEIDGHKVPLKQRRRLDIQDIPRIGKETAKKAVDRVRKVIYKRLDEIPAVKDAWNRARAHVEKTRTLTAKNYGEMYDLTRNQFWKEVRKDPAATKHFTDAGFTFPDGDTTAPLLGTAADLRKSEIRVSLDHIAEKAIGDNWQKALDAGNLRMEFAMPNTYREIIQMRHPELRALTE